MTYKVSVLVGSLRKGSYNLAIANAIKDMAAPDLELRVSEIGDLPHYNPDIDGDAAPAAWSRMRDEIGGSDAVLFVTPEYNRSIPGVLKNALDVGSRPYGEGVLIGKPAAIISVSPGGMGAFGAAQHLRQSVACLNMPLLPAPEVYIPGVGKLLDEEGTLINEDTRKFLKGFVDSFTQWIGKVGKA